MVMYYAYERFWSRVQWGRTDPGAEMPPPMMPLRAKVLWAGGTLVVVAFLFYMILFVSPLMKGK